jgi:transcriptional regulator with XRE-family HTH domain
MKTSVQINAKRLVALREKSGLSQKELAAKLSLDPTKSGVDPGTVSRWERGKNSRIRRDMFGRLRMVLRATEDDLCGEGPLRATDGPEPTPEKGQMNIAIDPACRNALALVADRYQVSRQQIVELAPLLFFIAAEQSLKLRQDELRAQREDINRIANRQTHLPVSDVDPSLEEILNVEEDSIKSRDLLGSKIYDWAMQTDLDSEIEWEEKGWPSRNFRYLTLLEECDNPFSLFLTKTLSAVSEPASGTPVVEITTYGPTKYQVCSEEALTFVGGNALAAASILGGFAAIHDMPSNLQQSSADPSERANWTLAELSEKYGGDFLVKMGSGQESKPGKGENP